MRVYIAGKISDLPEGPVFVKFNAIEYKLQRKGHTVVNPLRLCSNKWHWEKCMKICLTELMNCDAIYLLPDWCDSRGARLEYHIAQELKLKVLTEI